MDPLGGGPRPAYASRGLDQRIQILLDKSVPHIGPRWFAFLVVVLVYAIRVYLLQGFYIVTYGIGIYNLNLLIGFLSPQVDPDQEGPTLPTTVRFYGLLTGCCCGVGVRVDSPGAFRSWRIRRREAALPKVCT